jgi:hypothetical protein
MNWSRPDESDFHKLYLLVWVLLLAIVAALWLTNPDPKDFILSEEGPIEMIAAIGYMLCAGAVILLAGYWPGKWHAAFLLFMLGLRELDFHSRFTSMNLTKIKFYLSQQVPIHEKVIGFTVIALCLYAGYRLLRLEGRRWWADLKARRACAFGVLFGVICALAAKSLDGLARKLRDIGMVLDEQASNYATYVEETLEMGIALMFGLAIWCYYRHGAVRLNPPVRR